jgi:hypothetical protein
LIIFVIIIMNTGLKRECDELACRVFEIKELAKELEEED